ncbi:DUF461 domain-containing protein [Streptomyces orinoci]|uniref:DUF461 domain-containing protein n=1 Tax=Streptomyces orinoci TaxID=67339 RepID=A0ABV3JTZ4_STRON|nr:DUF461 domain-containing protein [Streptomyces orinoci]
MSSSLRRGALAATALVLSIATLSACGAGNSAQTLQVKPDNAATSVGDIKLQNMTVVTQPDMAAGPAVITGQVFNSGSSDQQLKAVTVVGQGTAVKLSPAKGSGPVVVPAHGSVLLGGKGNASAVLSDRGGLKDGQQAQLSFSFQNTGDVRISAFVYPAKSYFKEWGPAGAPSAPASAPAATPSGKPASPSAKPGGSAPAKPSGAAQGKNSPAPTESAQAAH